MNRGPHDRIEPAMIRQPVDSHASTEPRGPGKGPRGWNSRWYLPHFDSDQVIQHVTFHLADSLPKETVEMQLMEVSDDDPRISAIELRRRLEDFVDAGHGECWLKRDDCAQIVENSLLHFDGVRYRLFAWVVMPNHVHTLFRTIDGWSMHTVVGGWKTYTANAIGRIVRKPGNPQPKVWHPEFWDRFVRNEKHFGQILEYIHQNPVKAGLVSDPTHWRWSSAFPRNTEISARPDGNGTMHHDA